MLHLDLFSGIGGFSLACEWAGVETIGFVEIDKYCQKVLRKHWPVVPIVEDIRDVERIKAIANAQEAECQQSGHSRARWAGFANSGSEEIIADATQQPKREPEHEGNSKPIKWSTWPVSSSRSTNANGREARPQSPIILVTAGFPCQPFSVAGKRGSKEDDRYLWPETLAVIKAIKPEWVLLENVTGIINLALDDVLSDLEGVSYAWETLVIPAVGVGAIHRRDRIWVVANAIGTEGGGQSRWPISGIKNEGWGTAKDGRTPICPGEEIPLASESRQASDIVANPPRTRLSDCDWQRDRPEGQPHAEPECGSQVTANTQRAGLEGADTERDLCRTGQPSKYRQGEWQADWWAVEPELGRVAHGIPCRVDRLKCLGNAIVPQVAYEIIKVIAEIEHDNM